MRARYLAILMLVAGSVAPACGRKTIVKAPELVAPERIDNLAATNAPVGVHLTWRRPDRYADGTRMSDLGAFRVERRTAGGEFLPIATVAVTDRERLQQERRFGWDDTDSMAGQTYEYRVISVTTDDYVSQPSNVVTIARVPPSPAPTRTAAAR